VVTRTVIALALLAGVALAAPTPQPTNPEPAPPAPEQPAAGAPAPEQPAGAPTFGVTPPPADMIRDNTRLLTDARVARDAARDGHCDIVLELSPKLRATDPTFHQLFAADPLIAACLNPGAYTVPGPRARYALRDVDLDPPPSVGRISGELLLGMVVGAGGALIGALLGNGMCIGGDSQNGGGCDKSLIGGSYVGAIATIPFGVRSVGNSGAQTGSLGMTYLGSAIGGLGGLLMLASGRDNITTIGLILAPPIGAVIGFNATRRYKPHRVPVVGALVQWSDGAGASIGVPVPTRARADDRTVTSIPLVGGSF